MRGLFLWEQPLTMDEKLRQPYQGQLIKFTNVVKGWQHRWFMLDPESGTLQYFLSESDRFEKARGAIQLAGAVISPSDEDSLTFTVSPAVGESYKLRAHDTKDRQMWINRLRVIAEMHTRAIAHHHPPLAPREHRIRDGGSLPSPTWAPSGIGGLAVLDAFTKVAELLSEAQRQYSALAQSIEELPQSGSNVSCTSSNMLLLKATSQATLLCLDQCLSMLRSQHSANQLNQLTSSHSKTFLGSPLYRSSPPSSIKNKNAQQQANSSSQSSVSSIPIATLPEDKGHSLASSDACRAPSMPLASTSLAAHIPLPLSSLERVDPHLSNYSAMQCANSDSDDISDQESHLKSVEDEGNVEEGQKSIIMHIISQLRLGMDLTRVTLPTFILEKRSLLEMFADFLGHPNLFLRIANCRSPEDRIMAVVKWFLTSIHVGRRGSVAKKPYNPIIGETFFCRWKVPAHSVSPEDADMDESVIKQNKYLTIKFASEQVSHHPPVSAFFIECPEKEMCINAHVWTKSKFMGMSVGVNLIGDISLFLGGQICETYTLGMPSAFARSVLTEPWVELGGRVNIICPQTGCNAPIIFHTKPFYGGRLHKVTAEVKTASGSVMCRVQGEWDSYLEFTYMDETTETINIEDLDRVCRKRVKSIDQQAPNESRRQWSDVTVSLSRGDLDTATNHKKALEDRQRAEEKQRAAANLCFPTKLFHYTSDRWIYKDLPKYAVLPVTNNSSSYLSN